MTDDTLSCERRHWQDWTIEVRHLAERTIEGRTLPELWCATAWLTDTCYDGEHVIGRADTQNDLEQMIESRCRVVDLGSLDPVDVGYDVRATGTEIVVPLALRVRVRTASSGRHPHGETLEGAGARVRGMLRERGYAVAVGD